MILAIERKTIKYNILLITTHFVSQNLHNSNIFSSQVIHFVFTGKQYN